MFYNRLIFFKTKNDTIWLSLVDNKNRYFKLVGWLVGGIFAYQPLQVI